MSISSNEIAEQQHKLTLCHAYLQQLYARKQKSLQPLSSLEQTQGDITYQSMSTLIHAMHLSPDDIYLDLGSGSGRTVLHVFLLSTVKKAMGIEIDATLHQLAMQKYQLMRRELPRFFDENRSIALKQADFLLSRYDEVSVAFISAVCFSQTTLIKLAKKLNHLPNLRCVFSLKPLTHLACLSFKRTIRVQCSWGAALCYVYGR